MSDFAADLIEKIKEKYKKPEKKLLLNFADNFKQKI